MAICAYTSTRVEKINPKNPPLGVMYFAEGAAKALNQDQFFMDTKRLAWIPMDNDFFPDLEDFGLGIVKQTLEGFQDRVLAVMAEAARRPELMTLLGPYNPKTGKQVTIDEYQR